MNDGFLHRYFLNNAHKPLYKWVHYFEIYQRHLERFRGKSPVMVEIGVWGGGSMAMWKEYLGPGSRIVGIDIDPDCRVHQSDDADVFIGSQDDPSIIDAVFAKYPRVDIVLDDGSHMMNHMIATFELMYARMHANGVYMVEDTHTCYWEEHGGGVGRAGSFMEFAKQKLDEMNASHTRGALPISDFTRSTDHMSFYDSVVVFERRPQGVRQALFTQRM